MKSNIRTELNRKLEKINEQQQKIFQLEQELFEFRSKSNGESQAMKELKNNYDNLKSGNMELKNQIELLNMKYQSLTDENFSLKRDLIFLEKEIKNKEGIIDRLRNELLESNKKAYSNDYYTNKYSNEGSSSLNKDRNNYNTNYGTTSLKLTNEISRKSEDQSKPENRRGVPQNNNATAKTASKKNYYNESVTNDLGVLPSQMKTVKNENKILETENKIVKMQKEREQIQAELEKMPEFPKTKVQILKKKDLEATISTYSKEIARMKQDLKEMNQLLREG